MIFPRHYLNFIFALFIFHIIFSFLLWYNTHTEKCVKRTNFKVRLS